MADDWTKRVNTRSVYQSNDLFDEENITECVAWFLPKWAYYVARSFLFDYGQRITSFSLDYRTGLYLLPSVAQFDEIEAVISEALGGDIVCVNDIVVALNGIETAILEGQSSIGCEGTGSSGADEKEEAGTTFVDNGVDDPTGGAYADYNAYKTNKCGWAEQIISDIEADLALVSGATILTWLVNVLVIALVTPVPFDDIIAMVATGLAFVVVGGLAAFISLITDELTSNRDDFLCAMINAGDVASAQSDFLAVSSLGTVAQTFFGLFVNTNSFNRLFTKQADLSEACPDCGECALCDFFLLFGTSGDGINFSSTFDGTNHRLQVYVNTSEVDTCTEIGCGPETTFVLESTIGITPIPAFPFQIDACIADVPTNVYGSTIPWTTESGRTFSIFSTTSFSVVRGCP